MKSKLFALVLVTLAALACNDGPTSPVTIGSGSGPLDVAGTWTGTANDSAGPMTMTWRLTQSDRNLTGTFNATTTVGAPIYTAGAITGTVSATAVSFTITVPAGGIFDAPDCSATFTGTADDVQPDSMAGTYAGTDSCGGTFVGGRFTLLKQ